MCTSVVVVERTEEGNGALAHPIVHPRPTLCARARARQVRRWRTVAGMMSGAGMGLLPRVYIRAHVRGHTGAFAARVYAPPVGPSYRVVGDRDGWRVAEVSLTLDGVPVRIVILRDAQRRGALRVSYLPFTDRASVEQQLDPTADPVRRGSRGGAIEISRGIDRDGEE